MNDFIGKPSALLNFTSVSIYHHNAVICRRSPVCRGFARDRSRASHAGSDAITADNCALAEPRGHCNSSLHFGLTDDNSRMQISIRTGLMIGALVVSVVAIGFQPYMTNPHDGRQA